METLGLILSGLRNESPRYVHRVPWLRSPSVLLGCKYHLIHVCFSGTWQSPGHVTEIHCIFVWHKRHHPFYQHVDLAPDHGGDDAMVMAILIIQSRADWLQCLELTDQL